MKRRFRLAGIGRLLRRPALRLLLGATATAVAALLLYDPAGPPRLRWASGVIAPQYYLRNAPTRDFYFAGSGSGTGAVYKVLSSGEQGWFKHFDLPLAGSSAAFKRAGDLIYVVLADERIVALRPDGAEAFTLTPSELVQRPTLAPLPGGAASLLLQFHDGSFGLSADGKLLWERRDITAFEPSPRLQAPQDGQLYAIDQSGGGARLLALTTTGEALWSVDLAPRLRGGHPTTWPAARSCRARRTPCSSR